MKRLLNCYLYKALLDHIRSVALSQPCWENKSLRQLVHPNRIPRKYQTCLSEFSLSYSKLAM